MTTLDWIAVFGAFIAAFEVTDALRFDLFAQEMKRRRPQAHKFN